MKSYEHVNNSSTFSLNSKISRCHSSAQKKFVLPWNNYRPVSVFPNLSKIFENILYNQIAPYFENNLSKCQTWLPKGLLSTKLFSSDNTKVQKLFRSGGCIYCVTYGCDKSINLLITWSDNFKITRLWFWYDIIKTYTKLLNR